jgi:hypothetical protein
MYRLQIKWGFNNKKSCRSTQLHWTSPGSVLITDGRSDQRTYSVVLASYLCTDRNSNDNMVIITATLSLLAYIASWWFTFEMLMLLDRRTVLQWGVKMTCTKRSSLVCLAYANSTSNFPSLSIVSGARSTRGSCLLQIGEFCLLRQYWLKCIYWAGRSRSRDGATGLRACRMSAEYISDLWGVFTV